MTLSRASLVTFALFVAILEAALIVPAVVWPDRYPPILAAVLAAVVAVVLVSALTVLLRRRAAELEALAAELHAARDAGAIIGVDSSGAIVSWSPGAAALFGCAAEDVVSHPFSSLWADPQEEAADLLDAIRDGNERRERRAIHRRKDGGEIEVSTTTVPIKGEAGETVGAVVFVSDASALVRARRELGELEAKHGSLIERFPGVPYVRGLGDRAETLSIGMQVHELIGYSRDEWLAQPELFLRLIHPDDRERVLSEMAAATGHGEPLSSEYRMLSREGRVVWVRDEAAIVRDSQGEALCVQGYLADVGERRRAANERERLLVAERAAATDSLNRQRKLDFLTRAGVVFASSVQFEASLRRLAELAVRDVADWCVVDLIEEDGSPTRHVVARGEPATSATEPGPKSEPEPEVLEVIRTGHPEVTAAHIRVPLQARGRVTGVLTLITVAPGRAYGADDVALAQNLAQMAALAIDNARLYAEVEEGADAARVLSYVGDGVFLVDRSGVVRLWNTAAESITGFGAGSVLAHSAEDVIPGWRALGDRIPVASSPEPVHAETLPIDTALGERWISISGVEFFDGTVYAFRDVTDDRRLQELKADFVATASHELRTPLAAVYGAAQTLRRHDFALDEAGRERFVSLIVDESDRLGRIVNEILLANQLDAGELDLTSEPFDGLDLLDRVVESVKTHAPPNVVLAVVAPESVPMVDADRDKVRQVLVNLVENAIKYSPDGGLIEVGVGKEAGGVRFSVRDQGLGIPSDEQGRIFEKFYRLDPAMTRGVGGTGLGLYICSELVERMGGRIWVESTPGEGSTFFFDLPQAELLSARVLAPEAGGTDQQ
jgi:PAS domain S-box-containing protein